MEGFGVLIVLGDIVIDGLDQVFDGTKIATANGLSSDLCKPAFDLINPGTTRRGKMQNVARSTSKPVAHPGRLVSGQIIQHQVNGSRAREFSFDQLHEFQEFLFAMTAVAFANDSTGSYLVSAKERDHPVAVIVVALTFWVARFHRQDRLGPF